MLVFVDFLEWWIGAIVWLVANVVYADMKRKGGRGFTRFAAFWAGTPTTWITFFALPEDKQPSFERTTEDDDLALLDEIRRDREARGAIGDGGGPAGEVRLLENHGVGPTAGTGVSEAT